MERSELVEKTGTLTGYEYQPRLGDRVTQMKLKLRGEKALIKIFHPGGRKIDRTQFERDLHDGMRITAYVEPDVRTNYLTWENFYVAHELEAGGTKYLKFEDGVAFETNENEFALYVVFGSLAMAIFLLFYKGD